MRRTPNLLSALLLLVLGSVSWAPAAPENAAELIQQSKTAYLSGDFDKSIELLQPILKDSAAKDELTSEAREVAASAHQRRGEEHFKNARIKDSIADFDKYLEIYPGDEPGHWQRGISYYYAQEYEKGVKQFEIHRTVNPEDVENAVWHFLCAVRAPGGSVEAARKDYIPITQDPRVPMMKIHELFAGQATVEDVVAAAKFGGLRAKFYADLYIGLYYEALGDQEQAMAFIARAAEGANANGYMGDVARVHLIVRDRELKAKKEAN